MIALALPRLSLLSNYAPPSSSYRTPPLVASLRAALRTGSPAGRPIRPQVSFQSSSPHSPTPLLTVLRVHSDWRSFRPIPTGCNLHRPSACMSSTRPADTVLDPATPRRLVPATLDVLVPRHSLTRPKLNPASSLAAAPCHPSSHICMLRVRPSTRPLLHGGRLSEPSSVVAS